MHEDRHGDYRKRGGTGNRVPPLCGSHGTGAGNHRLGLQSGRRCLYPCGGEPGAAGRLHGPAPKRLSAGRERFVGGGTQGPKGRGGGEPERFGRGRDWSLSYCQKPEGGPFGASVLSAGPWHMPGLPSGDGESGQPEARVRADQLRFLRAQVEHSGSLPLRQRADHDEEVSHVPCLPVGIYRGRKPAAPRTDYLLS